MSLFPYEKAIEKGADVLNTAGNLIDKWGFTEQEKSGAYNQYMEVTDAISQQIRSRTRRILVLWTTLPYIWGWISTFPIMVISMFYPPFEPLNAMLKEWLKMYTPVVAAIAGPYVGYYGIQTIVSTVKNHKNNKSK